MKQGTIKSHRRDERKKNRLKEEDSFLHHLDFHEVSSFAMMCHCVEVQKHCFDSMLTSLFAYLAACLVCYLT